MMKSIDIDEKELYKIYPSLLEILLIDRTTEKNIIWATESYKKRGYHFTDHITLYTIVKSNIIQPRSKKAKKEQTKRSKVNAEVFTPSWICNRQNNLIDEAWFNKKDAFNIEKDKTWTLTRGKVKFPEGRTWLDYIKDTRLEVSCGEAPYLVSRYDTVSGETIELKKRIGLLDRKFRVLNENCTDDKEWIDYSLEALKSIYGFEWQGDNLILARENVLFTVVDYYQNKFDEVPTEDFLEKVATIISWNIWQMDGIKCVIPNSCHKETIAQINLFDEEEIQEHGCKGCTEGTVHNHNGIYSKIMDWQNNKKTKYVDMLGGKR